MGELIRNLHSIKVGTGEFMIELNEGYTEAEGRLIHIQNKHFRYLIREQGFLKLAATVLRAKSEMDYYKTEELKKHSKKADVKCKENISNETKEVRKTFAEILNLNNIDYRIIETNDRLVTLIVNDDSYDKFIDVIKKNDIKRELHPYGKRKGYIFLYQMKEFQLYSMNNVFIEIYFKMPCMSLTPKTWIPLDQIVQKGVWENKETDDDGCNVIDNISLCIYRLCWSVFFKNNFMEKDKELLIRNKDVIRNKKFVNELKMIFFSYTDKLISLLENERLDEIISEYYKFSDY